MLDEEGIGKIEKFMIGVRGERFEMVGDESLEKESTGQK